MTDDSPPPDYDQVVWGHRTTCGSYTVHTEYISPSAPPAYSMIGYTKFNIFLKFRNFNLAPERITISMRLEAAQQRTNAQRASDKDFKSLFYNGIIGILLVIFFLAGLFFWRGYFHEKAVKCSTCVT